MQVLVSELESKNAALSVVEEIHDTLFSERQVQVFVKRDDMIHPFISGNKWRKLKYIIEDAKEKHKDHLVTFGGAWSNHLLATACAGAKYGFKTTGFVRGEAVDNPVLGLCKIFGMELHFTSRESYKNKAGLFQEHFGPDPQTYFIDEGGAGELAAKGCAELIGELEEDFSDICCAAGTGTTAGGILNGINHCNYPANVHVYPVLKGGEFLRTEIKKYSNSPFQLHSEYHFGGYAKTSEELMQFIRYFCRSTGILIEPVYTGKLFFALYDRIKSGHFKPGAKILAIHTGGLTGILGKLGE